LGRLDRQLAARRHRVARVDREVEERAFELIGVRQGLPQPGAEDGFDLDRLAQRAVQQIRHAADQPVNVDRTRRERLAPGKREQLSGQHGGALARLDRRPDAAAEEPGLDVAAALQLALDIAKVAEDNLQDVVEIVRDAAGHLADRLHLLRLAQGLLRLFALDDLRFQLGGSPAKARDCCATRSIARWRARR
jgi:hypothetical protein